MGDLFGRMKVKFHMSYVSWRMEVPRLRSNETKKDELKVDWDSSSPKDDHDGTVKSWCRTVQDV